MPSLRDIRRRIKSVKNTSQITKAMQMVAASKMRRAQQAAINGRPYARLLSRTIINLRDRVENTLHPLLEPRQGPRTLVILLTTDKGLCGALNTNLVREVLTFDKETTQFISIGRKGTQFLARTNRQLLAEFPLTDPPSSLDAKRVSKLALDRFLAHETDRVTVLFPRFINTLSQVSAKVPLLPIQAIEEVCIEPPAKNSTQAIEPPAPPDGEVLFEPSPYSVLEALLPFAVHFAFYQMLLSTRASEHSARMVAMKNATDNARQLVKLLTLEYNKARQAGITKEILEIATAQLALS